MKFDSSVDNVNKDVKTTNFGSVAIVTNIDGVIVRKPIVHNDHRGRVFELYSGVAGYDDFWKDPIVYCYFYSIRANQVKGWSLHKLHCDRYTLIKGETYVILYDPRLDSPTHKMVQKVCLSECGNRQLHIPVGVWHININISENESMLINHPTTVYDHDNPDRYLLPFDTKDIPVDIKEYFPKEFNV